MISKTGDKDNGWQGIMAGATGFEPVNDGVKVRCVTASPHPNIGGGRIALPWFPSDRHRAKLMSPGS